MKKLTIATVVLSLTISSTALAESNYLPSYIEEGLVSICKLAARDKSLKMTNTIKEYHLKNKVVALNVVCNGQDIISFAERYGAVKTTAKLSKSIGSVNVIDIAAMRTYNYDVTFDLE